MKSNSNVLNENKSKTGSAPAQSTVTADMKDFTNELSVRREPKIPELMKTEEFLALPSFPIQRGHEELAKKLAPKLKKNPNPLHMDVSCILYNGPTVMADANGRFKPAPLVHGTTYKMNGHCRGDGWEKILKGIKVGSVSSLPIPKEVLVSTFVTEDPQKACETYYFEDNSESAEKPNHKIQGILRAIGLLGNLTSKKFNSGGFTVAMNYAAPIKKGQRATWNGEVRLQDTYDQVDALKETIVALDKLKAPGQGALSTQLALAGAFLAGKALGENSYEFTSAIKRLVNMDKSIKHDGIYWLIKATELNVIEQCKEFKEALPLRMGLFNDRDGAMDFISKCWLDYINGVKVENKTFTWKDAFGDTQVRQGMMNASCKDFANKYADLHQQAWDSDPDEQED